MYTQVSDSQSVVGIGCRKPWQQQQLHSIRVVVKKMYTQQGHMPLGMEGCTGRVERVARARVRLRWLSVPLTGYRKEKKSRTMLKRLALMVIQVHSHAVAVIYSCFSNVS